MGRGRGRLIEPVELPEDAASEIAAFTRAGCEYDTLTTELVRRRVFADPDAQVVLGVYDAGLEAVGAAVVRGDQGFVKLIAVHPRIRRSGVGTALCERLERFCRHRGASSVVVGPSSPVYVAPGVDVRYTDGVCFFTDLGYERVDENVNLVAVLRDLPEPPLPVEPVDARRLETIEAWVRDEHPAWLPELRSAAERGECVACGGDAFACFEADSGTFGPIATRSDARGRGVGAATLLGALHEMRQRGLDRAEIVWAAALGFYSTVARARVSRVFWVFRKAL